MDQSHRRRFSDLTGHTGIREKIFVIPAHFASNKGLGKSAENAIKKYQEFLLFSAVEVRNEEDVREYNNKLKNKAINKAVLITGSDNPSNRDEAQHSIEGFGKMFTWIKLSTLSFEGLLKDDKEQAVKDKEEAEKRAEKAEKDLQSLEERRERLQPVMDNVSKEIKEYGTVKTLLGILFIITMYWALKVEKLKKKNDIQTYKEIVAFTEGKKLDELHKAVEVGKRPYQNILKVIISAGVTAMICFLIGVLMHVFLN